MDYLLKTEPTVYSFADLEREKTTRGQASARDEARGAAGDLPHRRREKCGRDGIGGIGGSKRSQNSASEDQSWEGDREAENPGGNQGASGVCGVSTSAARTIERSAANRGAVRLAGRGVRVAAILNGLDGWECPPRDEQVRCCSATGLDGGRICPTSGSFPSPASR